MNKIVLNKCYGGFSLSREAVLLAREISGNPEWGGSCIKGDVYYDDCSERHVEIDNDYGYIYDEVSRHDPVLVQVVETLGRQASGDLAELVVHQIKGSLYKIDEYDGMERVVEPSDINWIVIEAE